MTEKLCDYADCSAPILAKGYCGKHYKRFTRYGDAGAVRGRNRKPCSYDDCSNLSKARGYCQKHYQRLRKYGDPGVTTTTPHGEGKPYTSIGGYVTLPPGRVKGHPNARKNGSMFEHVFVMSEILGRPLLPHENVHHKNGDRADNSPENLELWSRSQPPGQRVEDKVLWAKEILTTYLSREDLVEWVG